MKTPGPRKVLACLLFFLALNGEPAAFAEEWQELKGDHFIVFYRQGKEDFAGEVLKASEDYYKQIAADLGYARYSNFWQWEKRVKIFLYPDQESFLRATGQPAWSIGNANYQKKQISSYSGCEGFLISTLPHEIAHLIFRDFVGFQGEVPLWLDEGVAQWQELPKREAVRYITRQLYDRKKLLSLERLTRTDVRQVRDDLAARDFYVQAASVVGFLIERFGADRFSQFCRQLRDGKTLDDSLRFTYPTEMRSLKEMEEKWRRYVAETTI